MPPDFLDFPVENSPVGKSQACLPLTPLLDYPAGKNTVASTETLRSSLDEARTEAIIELFERINGAFLERGCAAAFSVADDDNTIYWLGDDGYGPLLARLRAGS